MIQVKLSALYSLYIEHHDGVCIESVTFRQIEQHFLAADNHVLLLPAVPLDVLFVRH